MHNKIYITIKIQQHSFMIMSLDGYESLSRPYYFDVTFQTNNELDYLKFFHQTATITIYHNKNITREITGIIVKTSTSQDTLPQHKFINITITSPLSLLKNKFTPRLFLNKKTKDVIEQLLQSVGIQSFTFNLEKQYETHPMIMQAPHESDFSFLQRITAKEGFYYYFDHNKIIFSDNNALLTHRNKQLAYHENHIYFDENTIYNSRKRYKIVPEKFIVREYNAILPDQTITIEAANQKFLGNINNYGLGANDSIQAEQFADHLKQRSIVDSFQLTTHSYASDCYPGLVSIINLDNFDQTSETNYVITEVIHHYRYTKNYSNRIKAIDSKNIYQSPFPIHPKIPLCFTARIESNSQFAHSDENGRYKLRYDFDKTPFDHSEASPFIRRLNIYNGYLSKDDADDHRVGAHFPLLDGTMVLVSCFDGNPDRPFIVGPLPNQQMLSPVTYFNPSQNVIATQTDNKFIFEDDPEKLGIILETSQAENTLQMISNPNQDQLSLQSKKGSLNIFAKQDFRVTTQNNYLAKIEKNSTTTIQNDFKLQTINGFIQYTFQQGLISTQNNIEFNSKHNIDIEAQHDINISSNQIDIQAESIQIKSDRQHVQLIADQIKIQSHQSIHLSNGSAGILLTPSGTITIYGQQISGNIAYNGKVNQIPSPASQPMIDE